MNTLKSGTVRQRRPGTETVLNSANNQNSLNQNEPYLQKWEYSKNMLISLILLLFCCCSVTIYCDNILPVPKSKNAPLHEYSEERARVCCTALHFLLL